jgi:glycosyltransferase involved in cell wall biosynthesis
MRPSDAPALQRGRTVVCVVCEDGQSAADEAQRDQLVASTAPDVGLLVAELARLDELDAAVGDADLVLLSARARVVPEWIGRLRAPAAGDGSVGTVTPLGDEMLGGSGDGGDNAQADQKVRVAAAHSWPRVLVGGPDCLYVPRRTLELIGGLPRGQPTLAAVMAELCARAQRGGLVNVVADDLYISSASTAPGRDTAGDVLDEPDGLGNALDEPDGLKPERSPLGRSVSIARAATEGLTVTIDARSLGPAVGGTQRYTLDLLLALARFTDLRLRAVVARDIDPAAAAELHAAQRVEVITYEQAVAGVELSEVVHRPQQVFSTGDLNLLALLGRRLVLTHQDLIGYHNPAYHETHDSWAQYRRVTRQALAAADRVVFFSDHSRHDAIAEDLVRPERSQIIGAAVFALGNDPGVAPEPAPGDFILCLGSDYRHKNRPFAIAVAQALRAHHDWRGTLVLAGPHVPYGSSRAEETRLLDSLPGIRDAVVDLGSVSDAHRTWLLLHASAVIVPSVVEGFGLVPLEAADADVPCLFAPQPPLTEVISPSLATLVPWDPTLSAANALPLLSAGPARDRHREQLSASAARWSWEQIAHSLVECYTQTMRSPYRIATEQLLNVVRHEAYYQEVVSRWEGLGDRTALAEDDGFLRASEQRGLLRVGSRPALARVTLWPFAALGAVRRRRRES